MFTGIIEDIGIVKDIEKLEDSFQLSIETGNILEDAKIGDSIAINGVCLTMTDIIENFFKSDIKLLSNIISKNNKSEIFIFNTKNKIRNLDIYE